MCSSATANFVGGGILGTPPGVVTLTKVKHRRELLFAFTHALCHSPVHREFVWLGLDSLLAPVVTHDMM